jgi:WD40 repeat protein
VPLSRRIVPMESFCFPCAPNTTRGRATLFDGNAKQLVYACGRNVAIVDMVTMNTKLFTEHAHKTTTVRLSPDGTRAASGDSSGVVKVWALADRACVNTVPALAGAILDVAWSADGTKVACAGEGRGRLAQCFGAETQNSLGAFDGLSRPTNSIAFTTAVPGKLGLLTGSDDGSVKLFAGVPGPFAFVRGVDADAKASFVNCLRSSPADAQLFAVASAQLKLHRLDGGATTPLVGHAGSVLAVSFSPAGTVLASAGVDKTVRLFDVRMAAQVHSFTMGTAVRDMQCGVLFADDTTVASVSLSGDINLFDTRTNTRMRVIQSHQKNVTSLCGLQNEVTSSDYEGTVLTRYLEEPERADCVLGRHTNSVVGVHAGQQGLVTVGLDDKLLIGPPQDVSTIQLPGAPSSLGVSHESLSVVVTTKGVVLASKDKGILSVEPVAKATVASITADGTEVAVGCEDGTLRLYAVKGVISLELTAPLPAKHRGALTAVRYSPNGKLLATADADRAVYIWDVAARETKATGGRYHSSRVTALSWHPDGSLLASGGLDCTIFVWRPDEPAARRNTLSNAHRDGVTCVGWCGSTLVSAGADCVVRAWKLEA